MNLSPSFEIWWHQFRFNSSNWVNLDKDPSPAFVISLHPDRLKKWRETNSEIDSKPASVMAHQLKSKRCNFFKCLIESNPESPMKHASRSKVLRFCICETEFFRDISVIFVLDANKIDTSVRLDKQPIRRSSKWSPIPENSSFCNFGHFAAINLKSWIWAFCFLLMQISLRESQKIWFHSLETSKIVATAFFKGTKPKTIFQILKGSIFQSVLSIQQKLLLEDS